MSCSMSPGFLACERYSIDKRANKISLFLMAAICFCNLWLLSSLVLLYIWFW